MHVGTLGQIFAPDTRCVTAARVICEPWSARRDARVARNACLPQVSKRGCAKTEPEPNRAPHEVDSHE